MVRSPLMQTVRSAAVVLALLAVSTAAQPQTVLPAGHGQIRALVIGMDEYDEAPTLKGAVADAVDLEQTLRAIGVDDLTVFIGYDATRDAIEGAMNALLDRARAGDLVIVTFAGHGVKERERVPGSEADGYDEVFLLAGWQPSGAATRERIFDKEINKWLRQFEERGVDVVFVADVCYGGGLVRSVDPRAGALTYRSAGLIVMLEDELTPIFTEEDAFADEADFERVTFLSGADQSTLVPEVQIPGIPGWRGALSYAVARAIEGGLEPGRDGSVTRRQLFEYTRQLVYQYSETRQAIWTEPTRSEELLDRIVYRGNASPTAAAPAAAEPVRLRVINGAAASFASLGPLRVPFRWVDDAEPADLVWDVAAGEVVSAGGDLVAQNVAASDLPAIVDRTAAVRAIARLAEASPQTIRVLPDDGHHRAGDHVAVRVGDAADKFLILFNIAYDGTVQFLFPRSGDRPQLRQEGFRLDLRVQQPFGADHVVAIVADRRLVDLERRIRDLDGQRAAGRLLDILPAARAADRSMRIGAAGLFTVPLAAREGG